jgi:predicted DNA-binding WGR domain protein
MAASKKSKPGKKSAVEDKRAIAIREAVDGLAKDDVATQVAAVHVALAALAEPQRADAAAAILAETKKGHAVARAYLLTVIDPVGGAAGADTLVKHCATMARGRRAMRAAFVAVCHLATDHAALDAALANFARSELDDPDLLAASVESAERRGDRVGAAAIRARLDVAQRLRPLVADLRGDAPSRARAKLQLADLSADERRHVHMRVLCEPAAVDEEHAAAAAIALIDDPDATAMALSAAMVDMRYRGKNAVVEAWQARVAAGDDVVIRRLIELFDVTAQWANDAAFFEPYIHALYPGSARDDVFGLVTRTLDGEHLAAREAIFEEWLREGEGRRQFTEAQIDVLIRRAAAVAATGDKTDDARAAGRALFYCDHPGARGALIDAMRAAPPPQQGDKLRWNIYYGLSHIDHPDVAPFLVERAFVERHEYWALREALEARIDDDAHRVALATFEARRDDPDAAHAVTFYIEAFLHDAPAPARIVALARLVRGWPNPSPEKDRRRLRHLFAHATLAALEIKANDDARAFLARVRELPAPGWSDFVEIDREQKTEDPLADKVTKKRIADLESGALDRAADEFRAQADAARRAGSPIPADDDRLESLAGCTIASRLLTDEKRHVVWFFDTAGAFHTYDGYGVVPADFDVETALGDNMASFLAGRDVIDDRALMIGDKGARVREVYRLGDRILIADGSGLDMWKQVPVTLVGLAFPEVGTDEAGGRRSSSPGDHDAARAAFVALVANPPDGTHAADPWYVDGAGAVRRKYYTPLESGGYNGDGDAMLAIVGGTITGTMDSGVAEIVREHATRDDAIAALQTWEGKLLARRGGTVTKIWIDRESTQREDTVLASFFEERYRDDQRDAAWHLRGVAEIWDAVVAANLAGVMPDAAVDVGPPATDAEIAAYQASVPAPLPAVLVALWRDVGGGGFSTRDGAYRLLPPVEIVARRDALRADLRTFITTHMKKKDQRAWLDRVDTIDVIATRDEAPLILFDTAQKDPDGRCFITAGSDWWDGALGWHISEDIVASLKRAIEVRIPDVFRLRLGQRASADARRVRMQKGDKFWDGVVDGAELVTRHGSIGTAGKASVKKLASPAAAAAALDKAIGERRAKGFE